MSYSVDRFIRPLRSILPSLEQAYLPLTRPSRHCVLLATALDVTRSKGELVAENALLRQQLVTLNRLVKKPLFWPKTPSVRTIGLDWTCTMLLSWILTVYLGINSQPSRFNQFRVRSI